MSVQQAKSDALAPQCDSSDILITRLGNWKYTIEYLIAYFQNYHAFQKQSTVGIEKLRKGLNDPPQFLIGQGVEPPKKGEKEKLDQTNVEPPADGTFGSAFLMLQRKTDALATQSDSAAQTIKNTIIPQLQTSLKEIEQQQKHLKNTSGKLSKSVEKYRESTEKLVERLGKFAVASTQIDAADDPYVLSRRIKASIAEQIEAENQNAEQSLSLQNNFLTFEQHIVGIIQGSLQNLQHVVEKFSTAQISSQVEITQAFDTIDKSAEWNQFISHNRDNLVPQQGYQRSLDNVTFANEDHSATRPTMTGHLTRTSTVLRKLQTYFYAVTPSGYLQEFKSEDPTSDPSPSLSLYLPHSVLGTLPPPTTTDFSFKIDAKNSQKKLSRGHSYQFRASNYDELSEWYYAIARKCLKDGGEQKAHDEPAEAVEDPNARYSTDSEVINPHAGPTTAFGTAEAEPTARVSAPTNVPAHAEVPTSQVHATTHAPALTTTAVPAAAATPTAVPAAAATPAATTATTATTAPAQTITPVTEVADEFKSTHI